MAYLKFSENLFLGKQELQTFKEFVDNVGFRKFVLDNSESFGLVKNSYIDVDFDNGKIEAGTNVGTIKIPFVWAVDSMGNIINLESEIDNIAVPNDSTPYWVKIAHAYSSNENGSVSVDINGNLTGIGTSFLSKLRGQPNFPSKIKFTNGVSNTLEYTVLEVIDDNNAVLEGDFINESNLTYSVVGTFTPDAVPPVGDREIFQYDYFTYFLIQETSGEPSKSLDEFWLARVTNNGGTLVIEDRRKEIWKSRATEKIEFLDYENNKFLGVESVKWDDAFSTRDKNIVRVAWGLRTTNWTSSSSLRQITISNGDGGRIKRDNIIDNFVNGDFNGWRLYFKNGNYSLITNSIIDSGAIKVTLDSLDNRDFNSGDELIIVPNVEEIQIKALRDGANFNTTLLDKEFTFNIASGYADISLLVPASSYSYNLKYRYKNNAQYTEYKELVSDTVGYYAESSFDSRGVLDINPANWVIKPYTSHISNGFIELIEASRSFNNIITSIDLGDLFGVERRTLSNTSSYLNLVVGQAKQYQFFEPNSINFSTNHVINLSNNNTRNGNQFMLHFSNQMNFSGFSLTITKDFDGVGLPPANKILVSFTEFDRLMAQYGNFFVKCVYDGSQWIAFVIKSQLEIGNKRVYNNISTQYSPALLPINQPYATSTPIRNGANFEIELEGGYFYKEIETHYSASGTYGQDSGHRIYLGINDVEQTTRIISQSGATTATIQGSLALNHIESDIIVPALSVRKYDIRYTRGANSFNFGNEIFHVAYQRIKLL